MLIAMERAAQYQQRAEECERLAKHAKTARERAMLIGQARAWRRVAEAVTCARTERRERSCAEAGCYSPKVLLGAGLPAEPMIARNSRRTSMRAVRHRLDPTGHSGDRNGVIGIADSYHTNTCTMLRGPSIALC
jgi:hypothetical protein